MMIELQSKCFGVAALFVQGIAQGCIRAQIDPGAAGSL
jgi:hypothetical protein